MRGKFELLTFTIESMNHARQIMELLIALALVLFQLISVFRLVSLTFTKSTTLTCESFTYVRYADGYHGDNDKLWVVSGALWTSKNYCNIITPIYEISSAISNAIEDANSRQIVSTCIKLDYKKYWHYEITVFSASTAASNPINIRTALCTNWNSIEIL